jgi:hypothetical protein
MFLLEKRIVFATQKVVRLVTTKYKEPISNPFNTTVMPLSFRWTLIGIMGFNLLVVLCWYVRVLLMNDFFQKGCTFALCKEPHRHSFNRQYYFVNGCFLRRKQQQQQELKHNVSEGRTSREVECSESR